MSDREQPDQANLEQKLVQHTRRLSALYTILNAYHQVNDLDEMMKLTLNQVLKILAGSVGSIHLFDETGETLHLAAHQGMSNAVLQALQHLSPKDEIVCEIISGKKSLIITDIRTDPRLAEISATGGWDVFIGIPITYGKKIRGVLAIYGDKTHLGTAEEIELLEILAGQIGMAIENSHLREQAERLAIVDERNRLARELHDSVTQSLYSLTLFAETAQRMMEVGEMIEARRCLTEIADSSLQALKEMRLLVHKLRPTTYKDVGLANSIEQRLRAVEGRSGIKFDFRADKTLFLNPEAESALYAVAVEALNNALKHARADRIQVALLRDGNFISLEISDNGSGFDLDQARESGGLGLASVQERVAELQGDIQINSVPGEGSTIRVRIPISGADVNPDKAF